MSIPLVCDTNLLFNNQQFAIGCLSTLKVGGWTTFQQGKTPHNYDSVSRIEKLYQMLYTEGPNGMPVVIYNHCEAGTDRTGEVVKTC
jgi:hypothetical protein